MLWRRYCPTWKSLGFCWPPICFLGQVLGWCPMARWTDTLPEPLTKATFRVTSHVLSCRNSNAAWTISPMRWFWTKPKPWPRKNYLTEFCLCPAKVPTAFPSRTWKPTPTATRSCTQSIMDAIGTGILSWRAICLFFMTIFQLDCCCILSPRCC